MTNERNDNSDFDGDGTTDYAQPAHTQKAPARSIAAQGVAEGLIRYSKVTAFISLSAVALLCVGIVVMQFYPQKLITAVAVVAVILLVIVVMFFDHRRTPVRPRRDEKVPNGWGRATTLERIAFLVLVLSPSLANFLRISGNAIVSTSITAPLLLIAGWFLFGRHDSNYRMAPRPISATDAQDTSAHARVMAALESAGVVQDSALNPYEEPAFPRAADYVPGRNMLFVDVIPQITGLDEDAVARELGGLQRDKIINLRQYTEGWTAKARERSVVEAVYS